MLRSSRLSHSSLKAPKSEVSRSWTKMSRPCTRVEQVMRKISCTCLGPQMCFRLFKEVSKTVTCWLCRSKVKKLETFRPVLQRLKAITRSVRFQTRCTKINCQWLIQNMDKVVLDQATWIADEKNTLVRLSADWQRFKSRSTQSTSKLKITNIDLESVSMSWKVAHQTSTNPKRL